MLINSRELKAKSFESIKNTKPSPMLGTAIILLISGISSSLSQTAEEKEIFGLIGITFLINLLVSILGIGYQWYCLNVSRNQNPQPLSMLEAFSRLGKVIQLVLLVWIKVLLWSLLFIVPGIIKSFSYSQSFYILYDNPDWTPSQCIEESKKMMQGNKLELFLFELSFIGWSFLSVIVIGIISNILKLFLSASVIVVIASLVMVPLYTYISISLANFYNNLYISRYNQY